MGLQADARYDRHQRILALLTTQPLTMKEVTAATGVKYHTIRNDFMHLITEGQIAATMETRGNSIVFRAGRNRPMPMVYHKASNTKIPLTQVALSYAKNPRESASSRATLDVGGIVLELLYMVALHIDTGHPNHVSLESQNRLIQALRTRLSTNVLHIESILEIAKALLKDETLWKTESLQAISSDTLFDSNATIALYENLLQSRKSD